MARGSNVSRYCMQFDPEELHEGYYIYAFLTPDNDIFYIGKGKKYRCYTHFSDSSLKRCTRKNNKIKSIIRGGGQVKVALLCKGLVREQDAYDLEQSLTKHYGLKTQGGLLYNAVHGGGGYNTSSTPKKKGDNWSVKLEKYTKEERDEWYGKANTPISRHKKALASKRAWARWSEEEKSKHIFPNFKNGAITDFTFWVYADLIYCIHKDFPQADRHQLAYLFKDKNKSKVFGSLKKCFVNGWVPQEDPDFPVFLESQGRKKEIICQYTLHPFAKLYLERHIKERARLYLDSEGRYHVGRAETCTAIGITEYKYRHNKSFYDTQSFFTVKDHIKEIKNLITQVRYEDGTCATLPKEVYS